MGALPWILLADRAVAFKDLEPNAETDAKMTEVHWTLLEVALAINSKDAETRSDPPNKVANCV
jgi:hypothetical protein